MMEQSNKFKLKNFVKIEPQATRLKSLRLPRDLSLGGTKVKKNYKPNLNVIRNKNEKLKNQHKVSNRKKKCDSFNSINRNKRRFVQSTGVFSEGIGIADNVSVVPDNKSSIDLVVQKPSNVYKPPETKREILPKVPNKHLVEVDTDSTYNSLVKNEDSDEDVNEKKTFAPIIWDTTCIEKESAHNFNRELKEYFSGDTNSQSETKFSIWQLPDSLPFCPNKEINKTTKDCKLKDIPEGKIGKIVMRKSGKVEVYISDFKYDLQLANLAEHKQELMHIDNIDNNISNLGDVQSRFTLSPIWKSLLSKP